jgi:hypothetical protein
LAIRAAAAYGRHAADSVAELTRLVQDAGLFEESPKGR